MEREDAMELATRVYGALDASLRLVRERVEAAWREARASRRHRAYRREYGRAAPDPYRLIRIDPGDVEYMVEPRFDARLSDHGTYILAGDWDRNTTSNELMYANLYEDVFEEPTLVSFDRTGFYRSAKRRYIEGIPWEDTAFYRWCLERIEADEKRSPRFATRADVDKRLALFDTLYEQIRTQGYRTQRELQEAEDVDYHKRLWPPERHEVTVSIGRDGQIFFDEGQHRFVIARLLELPEIPVRVIVRHRGWQETRAAVHAHSASSGSGDLDPSVDLDHPDLKDVIGDQAGG